MPTKSPTLEQSAVFGRTWAAGKLLAMYGSDSASYPLGQERANEIARFLSSQPSQPFDQTSVGNAPDYTLTLEAPEGRGETLTVELWLAYGVSWVTWERGKSLFIVRLDEAGRSELLRRLGMQWNASLCRLYPSARERMPIRRPGASPRPGG